MAEKEPNLNNISDKDLIERFKQKDKDLYALSDMITKKMAEIGGDNKKSKHKPVAAVKSTVAPKIDKKDTSKYLKSPLNVEYVSAKYPKVRRSWRISKFQRNGKDMIEIFNFDKSDAQNPIVEIVPLEVLKKQNPDVEKIMTDEGVKFDDDKDVKDREEAQKFLDKIKVGTTLYFNKTKEVVAVESIEEEADGTKVYKFADGSHHRDRALVYARRLGKVGLAAGPDVKKIDDSVMDLGNGIKIEAGQEYTDPKKPTIKYQIVKVEGGKMFYKIAGKNAVNAMSKAQVQKLFDSNPGIKLIEKKTKAIKAPTEDIAWGTEQMAKIKVGSEIWDSEKKMKMTVESIEDGVLYKGKKQKAYHFKERDRVAEQEMLRGFSIERLGMILKDEPIPTSAVTPEPAKTTVGLSEEKIKEIVDNLKVGAILRGTESGEDAEIVEIDQRKGKKIIFKLKKTESGEEAWYSKTELSEMLGDGDVTVISSGETSEDTEDETEEDETEGEDSEPAVPVVENTENDKESALNEINKLTEGAILLGRDSGDKFRLKRIFTSKKGVRIFEFENVATNELRTDSEAEMVNAFIAGAFTIESFGSVIDSNTTEVPNLDEVVVQNPVLPQTPSLNQLPTPQEILRNVDPEILSTQNLDASRKAYTDSYTAMLQARQDVMRGKRNWFKRQLVKITGEKISKEDLPAGHPALLAYEEAKKSYEDTKVAHGNIMYAKEKARLDRGRKTEEEKARLLSEFKSGVLFRKLILDEGTKLDEAKIEALPKRERGILNRAIQWYGGVKPKALRLVFSIAISTGVAVATGGIGVLGAAAGGTALRIAGGQVAAKIGIGIKGAFISQKKIDNKFIETKKNLGKGTGEGIFSEEWLKTQEGRFETELKKKKKNEKINRYINAGIRMSSSVGAGLMAGHFAVENAQESATDGSGIKIDHTPPSNPTVEHIDSNAIVRPGDGVENLFIRQIENNPSLATKMGWDGQSSLHSFAQGEAHRLAIETGYFDGGTEVRLGASSINHSAYVIAENPEGGFGVKEFVDGKLTEAHNMGSAFESTPDSTEYIYHGNQNGGTLDNSSPNTSGSGQMGGTTGIENTGGQMGGSGDGLQIDDTPLTDGTPIDLKESGQMGGTTGVETTGGQMGDSTSTDGSVDEAVDASAPDADVDTSSAVDAGATEAGSLTPEQIDLEVHQQTVEFVNKYFDTNLVEGINSQTWELWKGVEASQMLQTDELGHVSKMFFDGNYYDGARNVVGTATAVEAEQINNMLSDLASMANEYGVPPKAGVDLESYIEVLQRKAIEKAQ